MVHPRLQLELNALHQADDSTVILHKLDEILTARQAKPFSWDSAAVHLLLEEATRELLKDAGHADILTPLKMVDQELALQLKMSLDTGTLWPSFKKREQLRAALGACWGELLVIIQRHVGGQVGSLVGVTNVVVQSEMKRLSAKTVFLIQTERAWQDIRQKARTFGEPAWSEARRQYQTAWRPSPDRKAELENLRAVRDWRAGRLPLSIAVPRSGREHRRVGFRAMLAGDREEARRAYRAALDITELPEVQWVTIEACLHLENPEIPNGELSTEKKQRYQTLLQKQEALLREHPGRIRRLQNHLHGPAEDEAALLRKLADPDAPDAHALHGSHAQAFATRLFEWMEQEWFLPAQIAGVVRLRGLISWAQGNHQSATGLLCQFGEPSVLWLWQRALRKGEPAIQEISVFVPADGQSHRGEWLIRARLLNELLPYLPDVDLRPLNDWTAMLYEQLAPGTWAVVGATTESGLIGWPMLVGKLAGKALRSLTPAEITKRLSFWLAEDISEWCASEVAMRALSVLLNTLGAESPAVHLQGIDRAGCYLLSEACRTTHVPLGGVAEALHRCALPGLRQAASDYIDRREQLEVNDVRIAHALGRTSQVKEAVVAAAQELCASRGYRSTRAILAYYAYTLSPAQLSGVLSALSKAPLTEEITIWIAINATRHSDQALGMQAMQLAAEAVPKNLLGGIALAGKDAQATQVDLSVVYAPLDDFLAGRWQPSSMSSHEQLAIRARLLHTFSRCQHAWFKSSWKTSWDQIRAASDARLRRRSERIQHFASVVHGIQW